MNDYIVNFPALTLAVQGLPHEACGIEPNHVELTPSMGVTAKFHTENAICWQKMQVLYACSNDIALKGGIKNHGAVTSMGWENPSQRISNPSPFGPTLRSGTYDVGLGFHGEGFSNPILVTPP